MRTCSYTNTKVDGYGTNWRTQCGRNTRYESPIDVGFSLPPRPTEDGKYCRYCGGLIVESPLTKEN